MVRRAVTRSGLRLVAVLLLAATFIWIGVDRGLLPLKDLERTIRARSPNDLSPIRQEVPKEIEHVIHSLNNLLERIAGHIQSTKAFVETAVAPVADTPGRADNAPGARQARRQDRLGPPGVRRHPSRHRACIASRRPVAEPCPGRARGAGRRVRTGRRPRGARFRCPPANWVRSCTRPQHRDRVRGWHRGSGHRRERGAALRGLQQPDRQCAELLSRRGAHHHSGG